MPSAEATGTTPIVVIARGDIAVRELLGDGATCVEQAAPLGTGRCPPQRPRAPARSGPVLVVHGDAPLIRAETLQRLLAAHAVSPRACTLLVGVPADPSGLGRVIRDDAGHVLRIVEEARSPARANRCRWSATPAIYVFDGAQLWPALDRLDDGQRAGRVLPHRRRRAAHRPRRGGGRARSRRGHLRINDRRQLAAAEAALRRRTLDALMLVRRDRRGPGHHLRRSPGGRGPRQRASTP